MLEEKLREKSDGLNELIIKKELADRQVLIQEEEIKRLQETNASTTRKLMQLQGELERQQKAARDLEQASVRSQGGGGRPGGKLLWRGFLFTADPQL